jgi:hypothetical protein
MNVAQFDGWRTLPVCSDTQREATTKDEGGVDKYESTHCSVIANYNASVAHVMLQTASSDGLFVRGNLTCGPRASWL